MNGRLVASLPGTGGNPLIPDAAAKSGFSPGAPTGAFSTNGRVFATVGRAGASLWDATRWRRLAVLTGKAVSVAIAPNGKVAATVGTDRILRIWNESGASISTLPQKSPFAELLFSPNGRLLVVSSFDSAVVWSLGDPRRPLYRLQANGTAITFSQDGKLLATGEGPIHIRNASTGKSLRTMRGSGGTYRIGFSSDGAVLVADSGEHVGFWNVATGRYLSGPPPSVSFPYSGGLAGALSPDGRVFLPGPAPPSFAPLQTIRVSTTGQLLAHLGGLSDGAVISPDGSRIVGTGADGVARIYPCDECGPIGHVFALARAMVP